MPSKRSLSVMLTAICCIATPASQASEHGKGAARQGEVVVAGWVENGWLGEPPVKVKVKLDTGAKMSSIHAAQYREYVRDGMPRVSFTLVNNQGRELKIDQPVVRTESIAGTGPDFSERPVIRLKLCIAGVTSEVEFIMAERSDLQYPVLVGRSFLAGKILVDSARTFRASGRCGLQ